MKKSILIIMILIATLVITSCFPETVAQKGETPAGFLRGVWHGWIAPVSLIASLFIDNISIYDAYNTGWWYDAGYYIAIISGFGGISLSRKRKNKKD